MIASVICATQARALVFQAQIKNTPGVDGSGQALIEEFGFHGLSKTGMDNYPGFITETGRGKGVGGLAKENIPNSRSLDIGFEGGFSISSNAVYVNETPLVTEWLGWEKPGSGIVARLDNRTDYDAVKGKIEEFLINFPTCLFKNLFTQVFGQTQKKAFHFLSVERHEYSRIIFFAQILNSHKLI